MLVIGGNFDCPNRTTTSCPWESMPWESMGAHVHALSSCSSCMGNFGKQKGLGKTAPFQVGGKAGIVERACAPVAERLFRCGNLKPRVAPIIHWQKVSMIVRQAPSTLREIRTYYMYIYLIPLTLPECVSPFLRR